MKPPGMGGPMQAPRPLGPPRPGVPVGPPAPQQNPVRNGGLYPGAPSTNGRLSPSQPTGPAVGRTTPVSNQQPSATPHTQPPQSQAPRPSLQQPVPFRGP